MATVTICSDFGAPKIKSDTVSTISPSIFHEVMGPDATILICTSIKKKKRKKANKRVSFVYNYLELGL